MDFTGAVVRGLVGAVCLGGLVACARAEAPPVSDARVGFCVGIDEAHPADGRATVTFKRGDEVLGVISNVVTGSVSMPVTPGEVTVYVDGTEVVSLGVLAGGKAYSSSGTGCPATLSP